MWRLRGILPERSNRRRVIEFILDNLLLLPFLFLTYLGLEALEAHAGGALERWLGRARNWGPLVGACAGAVPQCGFSAAAASLYAGGVITVGTLMAVFLSTSDELLPVLISAKAPARLVLKIAVLKAAFAVAVGFLVNAALHFFGKRHPEPRVDELCAHSRCGCRERHGIVVPALVHTAEIFVFILIISGITELALAWAGEDAIQRFVLNRPVIGELLAGFLGLIPNCAVSVSMAELYLKGGMSASAMMSGAFTGSGVGLLVLFRTNRSMSANFGILAAAYALGVCCGGLSGLFFR